MKDDIQPTMRKLIRILNDHDFETTDSGDGKINVEAGMEGALDFPHVYIKTYPETLVKETYRLKNLMKDLGVEIREIGDPWTPQHSG